eukprot:maker-scaffold_12-snap-gene-12.11-mRNA-1 protein AED:0.18 eAED:0.18 QI:28/1/1/1/0.5/0.4/5/112/281
MFEYKFDTLKVEFLGEENSVAHVQLNREKQGNAMNDAFFREYRECFQTFARDTTVRVIIVSGNGKYFSVGLDLKGASLLSDEPKKEALDPARQVYSSQVGLATIQESLTAMEKCPQPVIACIHSAAVGGAVDLACAADIRFCSDEAWFCIKEVDIGLCADLGTLQRLHHCLGSSSLARELCYTARKFPADEALRSGFVSQKFSTKNEMLEAAKKIAFNIASKSPIAIVGTKVNLNYSRENTVENSLKYQVAWSGGMLQTNDIKKAALASLQKKAQPKFSKL